MFPSHDHGKYKTPQLVQTKVLVTSNFTIQDIICEGKGVEQSRAALVRRFFHVNIYEFLRVLGLKLLPKWDIKKLKQSGNQDPGNLFYAYDYVRDCPTGEPIKTPQDYQEIIRQRYYS